QHAVEGRGSNQDDGHCRTSTPSLMESSRMALPPLLVIELKYCDEMD
ncbi:hypothetical protein LINPERPRIM_LOCUS8544, partial [Linum perenne]